MNKLTLFLLSGSTILGLFSPLAKIEAAMADNTPASSTKSKQDRFCVTSHSRLICAKSSQIVARNSSNLTLAQAQAQARNPDSVLNFTDEESDAAVALFGCDCPPCLRALRQMRMMARVS
jgi:hypothetical protein